MALIQGLGFLKMFIKLIPTSRFSKHCNIDKNSFFELTGKKTETQFSSSVALRNRTLDKLSVFVTSSDPEIILCLIFSVNFQKCLKITIIMESKNQSIKNLT